MNYFLSSAYHNVFLRLNCAAEEEDGGGKSDHVIKPTPQERLYRYAEVKGGKLRRQRAHPGRGGARRGVALFAASRRHCGRGVFAPVKVGWWGVRAIFRAKTAWKEAPCTGRCRFVVSIMWEGSGGREWKRR